jgi:hypothetical protein
MKPDLGLIERLNRVDERIVYSGFDMFDDSCILKREQKLEKYFLSLLSGNLKGFVHRAVALYLSESVDLNFRKDDLTKTEDGGKAIYCMARSPLKSIVRCINDGSELDEPVFNTSMHMLDFTFSWYGKHAAARYRSIFPNKAHSIYPGFLVYHASMLKIGSKMGLPDSHREKCVAYAIVSDYEF